MSQYLETMLLQNGKINLLEYHQDRFDRTRKNFWKISKRIILADYLNFPDQYKTGQYKVRVVYGQQIQSIEVFKHSSRQISKIKLIENDDIDYPYKAFDRSDLIKLYQQKESCDEILIIKNGKLTDCFYYNVVLKQDEEWYTPKSCLLSGVQRKMLIETNQIKERDINLRDIKSYQSIGLINALTPLNTLVIEPSALV